MNADLHIHTNKSDGEHSPSEIVKMAKTEKLEVISITDHDNVYALEEAAMQAEKVGICFIPGIELSTRAKANVHILGYGIDYKCNKVLNMQKQLIEQRIDRHRKMIARLQQLGIRLDDDINPEFIGRVYLAKKLVELQVVSSINEAFDIYLNESGKVFIPSTRMLPFEGVEFIKQTKGHPVIAHPKKIYQEGWLEDLIKGLLDYGLEGLEVFYPGHDNNLIEKLLVLCKKYSLFATGGSDFHGNSIRPSRLGEINFNLSEKLYKNLIKGSK